MPNQIRTAQKLLHLINYLIMILMNMENTLWAEMVSLRFNMDAL